MAREANGNSGIILYTCKQEMLRKTQSDVTMLANALYRHNIP